MIGVSQSDVFSLFRDEQMTQPRFAGVLQRLTYSLPLRFESWPRALGIEVRFGRCDYKIIPRVNLASRLFPKKKIFELIIVENSSVLLIAKLGTWEAVLSGHHLSAHIQIGFISHCRHGGRKFKNLKILRISVRYVIKPPKHSPTTYTYGVNPCSEDVLYECPVLSFSSLPPQPVHEPAGLCSL